jgi:hypothetical protein
MPKYSATTEMVLHAIRENVLARPELYSQGRAFLENRYSATQLHSEAMVDWEESERHPTAMAVNRFAAGKLSWEIIPASEKGCDEPERAQQRQLLQRHLDDQLAAAPKLEEWTAARRAARAIDELMAKEESTRSDARDAGILLLAVMMWDQDADKRHQIFDLFGSWNERWAAAAFLEETEPNINQGREIPLLRRWTKLVAVTWETTPIRGNRYASPSQPETAGAGGEADGSEPRGVVMERAATVAKVLGIDQYKITRAIDAGALKAEKQPDGPVLVSIAAVFRWRADELRRNKERATTKRSASDANHQLAGRTLSWHCSCRRSWTATEVPIDQRCPECRKELIRRTT